MADWDFEVVRKKKRKFIRFEKLILHEDERVVVVNKPAGIASLSDREDDLHMLQLARKYNADLKLCHRLDKHTTGVLLFAKGAENYSFIAQRFEQREVIKHYLALVHGAHDFEEDIIDLPIEMSGKGRARINMEEGKDSATVVSTAEKFLDFTLLDCHPLTGRTHQIRIHLSSMGFPLVGDSLYGGKDIFLSEIKRNYKPNRKMEESPINEEFLLHARGLRLQLPGDDEETTFIAPLPKKFEVALKILRRYGQ
ncbi:MAG: RluA family pseudouridine synthase [Bacteroidota bacterium]